MFKFTWACLPNLVSGFLIEPEMGLTFKFLWLSKVVYIRKSLISQLIRIIGYIYSAKVVEQETVSRFA